MFLHDLLVDGQMTSCWEILLTNVVGPWGLGQEYVVFFVKNYVDQYIYVCISTHECDDFKSLRLQQSPEMRRLLGTSWIFYWSPNFERFTCGIAKTMQKRKRFPRRKRTDDGRNDMPPLSTVQTTHLDQATPPKRPLEIQKSNPIFFLEIL